MKIFLSGGGSGIKSLELDKRFANALDKAKPLLYIPIAIDKVRHPYPDCLKWIKNTFNPLGVRRIELWTEEDLRKKPESELNKFSGIYIGGGNTFYLLDEIKKSGFFNKLKAKAVSGMPVYGGSAGAIILGKTILTSSDKNSVKTKDFYGLDLVKGYSIFCHYDKPEEAEWVKDTSKKLKIGKAIALPENSGLFVSENGIEVVGPGSAYLPNENRTIGPKGVFQ